MRTVTALLLVFLAVAVAGLASDRSDVDSQVARGANRAYAPQSARLVLTQGPVLFTPQYTVIIRIRARDEQPEFCCLKDWTLYQLEVSDYLPQGTREPGISIRQWTGAWDNDGNNPNDPPDGTDYEGCEWTRVETPTGFRIGGSEGIFDGVLVSLVVIEIDGPEWHYRVSGCRGGTFNTEERSLLEYMKAVFPGHLSLGGNYFVFDTPFTGGGCVSHHGAYNGQAQDVQAWIEIFIWTDPCNLPDFPFPF